MWCPGARRGTGADVGAAGKCRARQRFIRSSRRRLKPAFASNALLSVPSAPSTGTRSSSPGPRSAISSPSSSPRSTSRGAGSSAHGATLPGRPLRCDWARAGLRVERDVLAGREHDTFVETLCGGDDRDYLYRGQCLLDAPFRAGTLRRWARRTSQSPSTCRGHGPVVGYATAGGTKVAVSLQRSTRGRELLERTGVLRDQHRQGDVCRRHS